MRRSVFLLLASLPLAACGPGAERPRLSPSTHAMSLGWAAARYAPAAAALPKMATRRATALLAQIQRRGRERIGPPPPCPDDSMLHIGRYCIDRYEAHLVIRGDDDELTLHPHYKRPPEGVRFEARAAPGVYPQAYISRVESKLACTNAGKRLCSWLEWRRACQGGRWNRYPYGGRGRRGYCNIGKEHLLTKLFAEEQPWKYAEHFNSEKLNQMADFLAKSGEYEQCSTPAGAYDMSGNLHEWVSTMVTDDFVERMEDEDIERVDQPWVVGNGMFLGGFYSTVDQHGPGCFYTTIAHEPRYHDYSTGFRCCATATLPKKKPRKRKPR